MIFSACGELTYGRSTFETNVCFGGSPADASLVAQREAKLRFEGGVSGQQPAGDLHDFSTKVMRTGYLLWLRDLGLGDHWKLMIFAFSRSEGRLNRPMAHY